MSRWKLIYDEYHPERQMLHEALCVLGNGYIATRGAFEETCAEDESHYPGTYLAGGYNRRVTQVSDRDVVNEDLVNFPNWLPLTFRPADGDWFHIDRVELLEFRQELDVRQGMLERRMRFRDADGRITVLTSRRIVHMSSHHLAAIQWTLTPENWSGAIEFRSALDGTVLNHGVKRYRQLESQHLQPVSTDTLGSNGIFLQVQTNDSHIQMAQAACTRVFSGDDGELPTRRSTEQRDGYIAQTIRCDSEQGQPLRVEKIVAIHTSRDSGGYEPGVDAKETIAVTGNFDDLLESHARTWGVFWHQADIEVLNGAYEQLVLRVHVFHLLQTYSFNSIDLDVGVPARGLHGEAYRGHIFWDELFIFPFVNLRLPELTRAMLMYRFRRLPAARRAARAEGYRGAMFPWQSGSNGQEETQVVHLNPKSGRWVPDNTHRQRHVNAAIVYNIWQYYEATNDREFLDYYGAPMILEICQFWSSIAQYNPKRERYEIRGVVGPDEFHTQYPNSDELGLHNNAYTNVMVAWCFDKALRLLDELDDARRNQLQEALGLSVEEIQRWKELCGIL